MARDNQAHYARIGFTVFLGAVAIAGTLIYMGGFRDASSEVLVETYSDSPVTGLSVGSPVNLFGVKVGEVREISFALATYWASGANTNDYGRVSIVMALDRKLLRAYDNDDEDLAYLVQERTKRGLRATVTANGITGLARIELKVVEDEPVPELPDWTPRYLLIPPSPSLMDSFSVAATKLMNKLKKINLDVAWSNVTRTAESAARAAESADAILEGSRAGVRQVLSDMSETASSFRALSSALKDNPSLLLRPTDPEPLKETVR